MIIKPWEYPLLRELLNCDIEMTSAEALAFLRGEGVFKSRASVIGTLNRLSDTNILKFREETAQGGVRKIYSRAMTVKQVLFLIQCELSEKYDVASRGLQGKVSE